MKTIQALTIILLSVAFVVAVTVGVWYYKTKFYIPDKDGMEYSSTDSITACYYSSSGGMDGECTEAEISINDKGEVWLDYYYCAPFATDEETIKKQVDSKAITDIRNICKKYGVLGWGKLKLSDIKLLDAATDEITLYYSDGKSYSVNTGYALPEDGEKIFDEIIDAIKQYK